MDGSDASQMRLDERVVAQRRPENHETLPLRRQIGISDPCWIMNRADVVKPRWLSPGSVPRFGLSQLLTYPSTAAQCAGQQSENFAGALGMTNDAHVVEASKYVVESLTPLTVSLATCGSNKPDSH